MQILVCNNLHTHTRSGKMLCLAYMYVGKEDQDKCSLAVAYSACSKPDKAQAGHHVEKAIFPQYTSI